MLEFITKDKDVCPYCGNSLREENDKKICNNCERKFAIMLLQSGNNNQNLQ